MDDTILLRNQLLHTQRLFRELQLVDVQGPVFETLIGLAKFKSAADIAVMDVRQLILDPASTTAIKTLIKVVVHSKTRLAQLITDAQDEAIRRSDAVNNDLTSMTGMTVSKVELMAQEVLRLRQALEAMKQQQAQVAMQAQLQHMAQAADVAAAAEAPCQPTLMRSPAGHPARSAIASPPVPTAAPQAAAVHGQARSPPQARPVLAAAPSGRPNMSALLAGASVAKLKRVGGGGQGEQDAQVAAPVVAPATTAAASEGTKADGPAMTLQAALMRKFANATPARAARPGGGAGAAGGGTSRLSLASSPGTPSSWDPDSPPKAQQQQRQVGMGAAAVMAKRKSARNVLLHMHMLGGDASSPLAQGGPAGVMRRQASVGHMPPPAAPAPVHPQGGAPAQAAPPPPAAPLPPALARLQQASVTVAASAKKKRADSEEGWSSGEEKEETPQKPKSIPALPPRPTTAGGGVWGTKVTSSPPRPTPSLPRSFEPQPLSALPRPPMDLLASIRKVARSVEEEEQQPQVKQGVEAKPAHAAGPAAQPVPLMQGAHSTPAKPRALLVGIQGFALGNLKKAAAAPSLGPPSAAALSAHPPAALNAGRGPVSSQGPGPSKPLPVTPARRGAPSQAVPPSPGPASLAVGAGGGGGSVAAQAATARLGLRKTGISRE